MKRKSFILSSLLSLIVLLTSACSGDDYSATFVISSDETSAVTEAATESETTALISDSETEEETTTSASAESAPSATEEEISINSEATEVSETAVDIEITSAVTTTEVEAEVTEASTEAVTTKTESTTVETIIVETQQTTTEKTEAETEETTVTTETPAAEEAVEKKYIALTFDDGPNTTTTNEVLDVLEKYNIVASFFLIGNNINADTESVVKRAYDMGCEIGNHSKTHSYMTEFTTEEIVAEIDYVNDYVEKITGEKPKFFRPPYISVNDRMLETIEMPFIAGFGANDWEERIPAERRANMILKQAKHGGIILLHDVQGNSKTVEALDTIIPELQAQGYEFVTVTGLFEAMGVTPEAHDRKIYTYADQQYMYG